MKAWGTLAAFVGGCTAGVGGTLLIYRPHDHGPGVWISGFMQSPGFAGVCALGAASIAFWGINRQMTVTRRAMQQAQRNTATDQLNARAVLSHQQSTDATASWWGRFEWLSGRAVPADKTESALPTVAVVRMFEALLAEAADDVQRAAVSGVMDLVVQVPEDGIEAAGARTGDGAVTPDLRFNSAGGFAPTDAVASLAGGMQSGLLAALQSYARTSNGTPGRSSNVEAALYIEHVLDAFEDLRSSGLELQREGHDSRVDARATLMRRSFLIEVVGWSENLPHASSSIKNKIARLAQLKLPDPILVVGRSRLADSVSGLGSNVSYVRWDPSNSPHVLLQAAGRVVGVQVPEPPRLGDVAVG